MYGKIAKRITISLIKSEIVESDEQAVYEYSIEVMLSDFVYLVIALITAISTNAVIETLLFYTGFFSIRKCAGGYHADTYWMCHVLFGANQLVMILLQFILPKISLPYVTTAITLISVICIFIFAPVSNKNREFTKNEYKEFSLRSRLIAVLTAIGISALVLANVHTKSIFVYAFGVFSVSISLMAEKIKNKYRKEISDEEYKRTD